jgi:hypothetical protein
VNNASKRLGGSLAMGYEVDYAAGEKEGCSSKLTIEHRIFYVKLFESPAEFAKYYGGDQHGVLKEISRTEFDLWLKILADKEADIEDIRRKISLGRKYTSQ